MKKLMTLVAVGLSLTLSAAYAADAKTTQQNKMGTCNAEAKTKTLKGDERKAFMKECLSAKPMAEEPAATGTTQQNKMKTCNADAKTQALKGNERKAFMKDCLSAK